MFHNLQNYDSLFSYQNVGKYNFKINIFSKTIEKYMSFIIIEQSKKDCINLALLLVFIDSIYFWGNSLENLFRF